MFMWKLKAVVIFRHLTKSAKWSIKPLGIKKDKAEFCLVTQTLIKQTAELYTISRWVIGVMKIKILFKSTYRSFFYKNKSNTNCLLKSVKLLFINYEKATKFEKKITRIFVT